MRRFRHKNCGGKIEFIVTITPFGVIKEARCRKCNKKWDVAAGVFGFFFVKREFIPSEWEVEESASSDGGRCG